jgi:Outer membrane protein beta-barrel domain
MRTTLLSLLATALLASFWASPAFAVAPRHKAEAATPATEPAAQAPAPTATVEEVFAGPSSEPTPPAEAAREAEAKPEKPHRPKIEFPDRGWHTGAYVAANVGMLQVTNDKNAATGQKFDGSFDPAFGITLGYDLLDWVGPMFQVTYATADATVGNDDAAGTFPTERARQHVVNVSLFVRMTAPSILRSAWQAEHVKVIPYFKFGGVFHDLFVHTATEANKVGAVGGGAAVGMGCEFHIWKGLFISLDLTENLIYQESFDRVIDGQPTTLTKSGFNPQFQLLGLFGWHF